MKRWILVIALLMCLELAFTKSTDKIHRKKLTTLKKKPFKNLSPKHQLPLDAFKELPADDLEFIKELDKQFQLHGDKVKIKIERANNTKNSKRTIDGDLGYGYQNPHHRYHFSRPKYMIYPYSQRDIPPVPFHQQRRPGGHHAFGRTSVTIEPSQAYEIKEVHNDYETYTPNHQLFMPVYHHQAAHTGGGGYLQYNHQPSEQQHAEQPPHTYVEPVIVLRIPGPTKYAAHLQALLQQYLEIRAAQYIKELQESEQQQQQHYHHVEQQVPSVVEQEQPQTDYQPQYEPVQHHHHHHQQQQQQQQQQLQQQHQYHEIDQVYENVRQHQVEQQQQQQQQQHDHYQIEYEHQPTGGDQQQHTAAVDDDDHHHHHHAHQQQQPETVDAPTAPQYIYDDAPVGHHDPSATPVSYQYVQEPIYMPSAQAHFMPHSLYGPPHSSIATQGYLPPPPPSPPSRKGFPTHSSHLQISENNPRNTHTKVIFTDGENNDNSNSYPLPSITPAPRKYEPALTEQYNHHQTSAAAHYEEEAAATAPQTDYQNHDESTIQITQRPFNYHAHGVRQSNTLRNKKRMAPTTEEQFRKLNKLIGRLKKKDEEADANGQQ